MKKHRLGLLLLAVILFCCVFSPVAHAATPYENPDIPIRFTLPDDWKEEVIDPSKESVSYQLKYVSSKGSIFLFSCDDIGKGYTAEQRKSEQANSLTEKFIKEIYGSVLKSVESVTVNNIVYFKVTQQKVNNSYANTSAISLLHLRNGILYEFTYDYSVNNSGYDDFLSIVQSTKYPSFDSATNSFYAAGTTPPTPSPLPSSVLQKASAKPLPFESQPEALLISLFVAFLAFTLPVLVFKLFYKKAMSNKKAALIVALYAIVGLGAAALYYFMAKHNIGPFAAVVMGSFVNHVILTVGKNPQDFDMPYSPAFQNQQPYTPYTAVQPLTAHIPAATPPAPFSSPQAFAPAAPSSPVQTPAPFAPTASPEVQTIATANENSEATSISAGQNAPLRSTRAAKFCRKCGARLYEDSVFCVVCGAKVVKAIPVIEPQIEDFDWSKPQ